MKDKRHIKSFDESTENVNISDVSESNSTKDKVVEMYISDFDMDEYIDYRLVVKTQSGKTFYVKAKSDSPLSFEED
jgi:hypothetical protein